MRKGRKGEISILNKKLDNNLGVLGDNLGALAVIKNSNRKESRECARVAGST
jgi:hypothetical protein